MGRLGILTNSELKLDWSRIATTADAVMTPRLQLSLEAQAIKEGLLNRSDYSLGELYPIPSNYGQRGFDPRVLSYLCLFPSITVTRSDFLLGPLMEATGIEGAALIEPRLIRLPNLKGQIAPNDFKALISSSTQDALAICRAQKDQLIPVIEALVHIDSPLETQKICRRSFLPIVEFLSTFYLWDVAATPFQDVGYDDAIARRSGIGPANLGHQGTTKHVRCGGSFRRNGHGDPF
jgi:hypothetical protein